VRRRNSNGAENEQLEDIDEESSEFNMNEEAQSLYHENLVKTLDVQVHQVLSHLKRIFASGGAALFSNMGSGTMGGRLGSSSRYSKRSRTPSAMNVKYMPSPNIGGGTGSTLQLMHHNSA
jgi:hypothetical protein